MNQATTNGVLSEREILTEWNYASSSKVSRLMPQDFLRVLQAIEESGCRWCAVVWPDGVGALVHWSSKDDSPPDAALLAAHADPLNILREAT